MNAVLFQYKTRQKSRGAAAAEDVAFADPWQALDERGERRENWLVSYIDILTLFLTLFVVLLVLQPKEEAPPVDADPGLVRVLSPEPIERLPAPPLLSVDAEPRQQTENSDLLLDLPAMTETAGNNETAPDPAQSYSLLDVLAEPVAPLIFVTAQQPDRPERKAESEQLKPIKHPDSSAVQISQISQHEPSADEPVKSREAPQRRQVQLFMQQLTQHHLDDRMRISEVAEGVYLEVNDNILFALGSADLKQAGATLLDELAQLLLAQKGIISVEGHTDDQPIANSRFPSNWELSSGRATTVTRYLIGKGMDPERLRAVGYAATRPLQSNATSAGRARNRRVALVVEIPQG